MNSVTRLFDIIRRQQESFPKQDAIVAKENGKWVPWSTGQICELVDKISLGLLVMGLQKGDKIALISNNRPEWNIADLGMLQAGVVDVPIYTTMSEPEIAFILNDCGAKYLIVSDADLYARMEKVRPTVPSLLGIFTFDRVPSAPHWSEISDNADESYREKLEQVKASVDPNDLATLLYTSGTTGVPKGVMLSHHNILSNIIACEHLPPVYNNSRALSFLPLCHSYERVLTYVYLYLGVSIWYAESMDKIVDNLKEVNPHIFSTVPRLLEKVYDRIVSKGQELSGIKKAMFFWALNLGLRYEFRSKNGWWYEKQLAVANKLVFVKWREALGGNVKAIVSGGAALQPRLARVFWAAQIPVLEGYGLTETSPIVAVNNLEPEGACFGTVGPVIDGVTVSFGPDSEILVKGPNIMLGYYNRTDLTAEVIDKEGWFHTGDIGVMEDGRYLKITDRKKEIFKTSGGKYIAPQAIENKFKESPFIEQIMVIGENRKFPAALIVPSFEHLKKWCEIKSIPYSDNEHMINDRQVIDRIAKEVEEFNQGFGQTEQVKKFALLPKEWTTASGDLTATLKLRRKIILERNAAEVEKIYSE